MKEKAVAYVRVSSKKQNVDRQISELNEYAKTKDFVIEEVFKDVVSASKTKMNDRKHYLRLKAYLASDKTDIKNLLIHEVSRLGRKNYQVQNAIEEFFQLGVNIHFMDMDKCTLDKDGNKSGESNIIISILSSMAENENRLLGNRIKSGLKNSAKNGKAFSNKITGYIKDIDGRPKIDKEYAPIVERMYQLVSEKTSLYFVSKIIKEEFGKEIHPKTISGIIKNPFYKGERIYLDAIIPVDSIVTLELWESANTYLSSRKNFTKRYKVNENILEGKIECQKCGKPMHQYVIKQNRSNMFKCSGDCSISVNRPWLYEMVRYVINKHTKNLNDKEFKKDVSKKIKENQQFIKDLKAERDTTKKGQLANYEMFIKGKVKEDLYENLSTKFEKDLSVINAKIIERTAKSKSYRQSLKTKPEHFSYDLATYKVQIQDILSKVEVDKNSVKLNINDMVNYTIPQLGGTSIGWANRKNKGKQMIFKSPFDTGMKVKNFITNDDLDILVEDYLITEKDKDILTENHLKNKA